MSILDWFKGLLPDEVSSEEEEEERSLDNVNLGANLDTRTEENKQKDVSVHEAFATANPVDWKEKPESKWRKFPEQDQDGSGSCVAQTMKKILGVLYWLKHGVFVRFSATHVYQRRYNRPSSGMMGVDAFNIAMKGVTLEELVPSEDMNDREMDAIKIEKYHEEVGEIFKIDGHIGTANGDFETVASVIQTTGKAVMVWFYFTSKEWSRFIPEIMTNLSGPSDEASLRHSVAAVDYTLKDGKKYIIIEDSAHFGKLSRRLISEEFFKKRNFFTRYPMNFKFGAPVKPEDPQQPSKPKYNFHKNLEFIPLNAQGEISDLGKNAEQSKDVTALQNILKYEGVFPTNLGSTGYYGSFTAKAVLAFQKNHNVDSDSELDALGGRAVGPKTRQVLNSIYGF